jgi:dual specificity protein kinase YAK1
MQPAHWNPYQDKSAQANRQSRPTPQTPLSPGQQPGGVPQFGSQNPYAASLAAAGGVMSSGRAPQAALHGGDRDGDIAMEDASDPYKPKHASLMPQSASSRTSHQRMSSNVQEESSAARRYSPMNLSPASPFVASQPSSHPSYTSYTPQQTSARTSPTRTSYVPSSPNYYNSPPCMSPCQNKTMLDQTDCLASRPNAPQLPPIQSTMNSAYDPHAAPLTLSPFGRDMSAVNSPRQPQLGPSQIPKGPVPKFVPCTNVTDLKPRVNSQPPFRRAKPEGGFLSVRQ